MHCYFKMCSWIDSFDCSWFVAWFALRKYRRSPGILPFASCMWHQWPWKNKNSVNFYSSVKQRFIPRLCSRSSLPPVIDDVKISSILEDAAISFYNNGKDGTCLQETEPRTCPLFTINYATLDCLNKDPRYKQLRLIDMIEIHACVRCWNAR
jgi:hypothetical protein